MTKWRQTRVEVDASTLTMKAAPRAEEGDAVRVPKYGRRTVAETSSDRITVSFASGETREFEPRYVVPAKERAA